VITLTIRQYEPTGPLTFSPATLAALVGSHGSHLEIRPAGGTTVTLRGTNHVGLIRTEGLDLVIQPKIPTLSVFWMLGFADRLVRFDPADFPLETEAGLLDVLARLFAKQTELVIRRGIHRAYVEREDNLRFVRGRIEPLSDLRTNHGLRHQIVCRYAELIADVPHNRILRAVTEQLLRYRYRLPGIRERLAWDAAHLAEVSLVPVSERDFPSLRYDRLNAHYRGVLALAHLIVRHLTFEFEAGRQPAPGFLVDMDKIFQEFLTRLVEEQARPMGLRLRDTSGLYLDQGRAVPIEPDIVLTDGHGIRVAMDAKYKRHDPQADVYQALAYAKGLGLQRVTLVYPADGEVTPSTHRIRSDDTVVLVRTVPVGHGGRGFVDLERRARAAATELVGEALRTSLGALAA
jgi:5-methylcytosine-specific restriction enzyme subunit McrC